MAVRAHRHITAADISAALNATYTQPAAPGKFWKISSVNVTARTIQLVQVASKNGVVPIRKLSAWHQPAAPAASPRVPRIPIPRATPAAPASTRYVTFQKFMQQFRLSP